MTTVASVIQPDNMAHNDTSSPKSTKSHEGLLRVRKPFYKKGSSRRVSCKDLGNGDCEGWLWKKKEKPGIVSRDWRKFWFTLKEKSLYYYKNRDDEMAEGIFQMPAFTVTYATDKESSRKFAFKVCHVKHGLFLFASERKDDMVKWMNTLQLACLPDYNPKQLQTIDSVTDDYSGSDSEDDRSTFMSLNSGNSDEVSVTSSIADASNKVPIELPSVEELCPDGTESQLIGSTLLPNARKRFERSIRRNSKDDKLDRLYSHLASLQRTLKDKESQLNLIKEFLDASSPVTSEDLERFRTTADEILTQLQRQISVDSTNV